MLLPPITGSSQKLAEPKDSRDKKEATLPHAARNQKARIVLNPLFEKENSFKPGPTHMGVVTLKSLFMKARRKDKDSRKSKWEDTELKDCPLSLKQFDRIDTQATPTLSNVLE